MKSINSRLTKLWPCPGVWFILNIRQGIRTNHGSFINNPSAAAPPPPSTTFYTFALDTLPPIAQPKSCCPGQFKLKSTLDRGITFRSETGTLSSLFSGYFHSFHLFPLNTRHSRLTSSSTSTALFRENSDSQTTSEAHHFRKLWQYMQLNYYRHNT